MHEKPQKRAGVDLYIVHKAIQLPRASTNQQKSKQNKNHKRQNTQKPNKQTKQHKNKTENRAKGQQCALEMNSDSSLCAILRAGHHTSRRMQMTTSVPCQRRPLNKKTTKTTNHKITPGPHHRVLKQHSSMRKPGIPPARIPEISKSSHHGIK